MLHAPQPVLIYLVCNSRFKKLIIFPFSECSRTSFILAVKFGSSNADRSSPSIVKERNFNGSTEAHFCLFKYCLPSHLSNWLRSSFFKKPTLWTFLLLPTAPIPLIALPCAAQRKAGTFSSFEVNEFLTPYFWKTWRRWHFTWVKHLKLWPKYVVDLLLEKSKVLFTLFRHYTRSCISCAQ